jgi:hypothetical protein
MFVFALVVVAIVSSFLMYVYMSCKVDDVDYDNEYLRNKISHTEQWLIDTRAHSSRETITAVCNNMALESYVENDIDNMFKWMEKRDKMVEEYKKKYENVSFDESSDIYSSVLKFASDTYHNALKGNNKVLD